MVIIIITVVNIAFLPLDYIVTVIVLLRTVDNYHHIINE